MEPKRYKSVSFQLQAMFGSSNGENCVSRIKASFFFLARGGLFFTRSSSPASHPSYPTRNGLPAVRRAVRRGGLSSCLRSCRWVLLLARSCPARSRRCERSRLPSQSGATGRVHSTEEPRTRTAARGTRMREPQAVADRRKLQRVIASVAATAPCMRPPRAPRKSGSCAWLL